jgi:hypothetical protein
VPSPGTAGFAGRADRGVRLGWRSFGSDQAFAGDEVRAAPVALPLGLGKSIEDERERFRAMWNGRPLTGQEIAEHEATLARIQVLSG